MKTYTEEQLTFALELQKAECYQKCGELLIGDEPKITEALDYLADNKVLSIEEVDQFIEKL